MSLHVSVTGLLSKRIKAGLRADPIARGRERERMVKGLKRAYPLEEEEVELSLGLSVGGSNGGEGADGPAGGGVRARGPSAAAAARGHPMVMNVLVASGRSGSGRGPSHPVAAWSPALLANYGGFGGINGRARMRRGLLGRSSQSVLVRGWSSSGSDRSNSSTPTLASDRPREQEVISNPRPPTTPAVDRMPCVVTKGTDGRSVRGLLYRYDEGEVRIVCVCHGSCFSPAGFVKHAGGPESSNPMRQIVVVPSQAAAN